MTLPARKSADDWVTVGDVLRRRARHEPDRLGYRFLLDGESREVSLTYGELDRRARAIGARLQSLGMPGERALLAYPPGLDFVCAWFGCAYAGVVAVALPPPHPGRARRFVAHAAAVVRDARPAVALTTSAVLAGLATMDLGEELGSVRWVAVEGDTGGMLREAGEAPARRSDLAFLQYTSGATTAPKGVMVTHDNLLDNLRAIEASFSQLPDRSSVSWLPPYHDMGLIGGILAPVYLGSPVTLMSPVAFVQRPRRWLQAITRFGAVGSAGPNFAYDLCVRRVPPERRAGLDLSSWRVAFNGAEPVNADTLRAFTASFATCGFREEAFRPCYGLAESTLMVSVAPPGTPPRIQSFREVDLWRNRAVPSAGQSRGARPLVSCGRPIATAVIVHPDSRQPCRPGEVGEIWVSGPSVAMGYWDQPAETERTFRAQLGASPATRFLRTGDLGFMLAGELFVTGRCKDVIIIDGSNHYPQDIERTVATCHPALEPTECAAIPVRLEGREALVIVAALRSSCRSATEEARRAIRSAVSEVHDLAVYDIVLVARGQIPMTPSGKVRRLACRAAYLASTLNASEER